MVIHCNTLYNMLVYIAEMVPTESHCHKTRYCNVRTQYNSILQMLTIHVMLCRACSTVHPLPRPSPSRQSGGARMLKCQTTFRTGRLQPLRRSSLVQRPRSWLLALCLLFWVNQTTLKANMCTLRIPPHPSPQKKDSRYSGNCRHSCRTC